jgi:hypothetical protein
VNLVDLRSFFPFGGGGGGGAKRARAASQPGLACLDEAVSAVTSVSEHASSN